MFFESRAEAGAQLAGRLLALGAEWPLVLGLSRGGLVVAAQVARLLKAQLDVWVTQRVAAPGAPEVTLGAVAEGQGLYLDPERMARASETEAMLAASREAEQVEALAWRLRGGRPGPEPRGRRVLLVDDRVVTGSNLLASAKAIARRGPLQIVAAVPLATEQAAARLESRVDALVCLRRQDQPLPGQVWYGDALLSDSELASLLVRGRAPGEEGAGR